MEIGYFSIVLVLLLFLLLFSGLWIGYSLMAVAAATLLVYSNAPIGMVMATTVWGESAKWALTSLPLFIWMGEILLRTRLGEDVFHGLAPWLSRVPGRLLHVNVLGSGMFAAVSGSSTATCATVGKITMPELLGRGYPSSLAIGSLAASGSIGLLIPPSIILIVYGVAAEVSVSRLFMAGVIPGILTLLLFSIYICLWSLIYRKRIPASDGENSTFWQKIVIGRRMLPVVGLIVVVIGSIYTGIATPTEAAALGVVGALVISFALGSLNWSTFKGSLIGATITSTMIVFILSGAAFLSVAMGFSGIPRAMAVALDGMNLSPYMFLVGLTVFFLILGCFLDGISIVLLTAAIILPAVKLFGFDLIWFGIYLVLVIEISMITPPVGFNLFVIQSILKRDLFETARAAAPFFFLLLLAVFFLAMFPELATWLPSRM